MATSRILLSLLVALLACSVAAHAATLKSRLASPPASPSASPSGSVDLGVPVSRATESTSALLSLSGAVARVSASLQEIMAARQKSGEPMQAAEMQRVLHTLASLSQRQVDIEQQQAEQSARDHDALLAMVRKQKQQQRAIASELQHSRRLEQALQQKGDSDSDSDSQSSTDAAASPSFLELSLSFPSDPQLWLSHPHAEHDIDLAHTMDHASDSALEEIEASMQRDEEAAQQQQQLLEAGSSTRTAGGLDPSSYSSSADYLAAMDSADHAEDMTPSQFQAFGAQLRLPGHGEPHSVGTPTRRARGAHSMSEIDAMVAAGEAQNAPKEFSFDPRRLRSPELQHQLSSLQDEDSIQAAMLRAHARVKAIAAELAKHQSQAGLPQGDGLEINFDGMDLPGEGHF